MAPGGWVSTTTSMTCRCSRGSLTTACHRALGLSRHRQAGRWRSMQEAASQAELRAMMATHPPHGKSAGLQAFDCIVCNSVTNDSRLPPSRLSLGWFECGLPPPHLVLAPKDLAILTRQRSQPACPPSSGLALRPMLLPTPGRMYTQFRPTTHLNCVYILRSGQCDRIVYIFFPE